MDRRSIDRRRYLALAGVGLGTALAGCPTGDQNDDGIDPTPTPDAGDARSADADGSARTANPSDLQLLEVSTDTRDEAGRLELPAAPDAELRIEAVLPTLHGEYEVDVLVGFRRDGRTVHEATDTIEGVHETTHTREGVERTETVTVDTTPLPEEPVGMALTLEDAAAGTGLTSGMTVDTVVNWPRWRRRIREADALLDESLGEFRDGPDGTILDVGFDSFDYLTAVRRASDALDRVETARDAVPPDTDPGSVFERLAIEIELVRTLAAIHRDLVGIFEDIEALRARVDADSATGRLRRRIESAQAGVETDLEAAEELYDDLLAIADPDALRSERYDGKLEQLEEHLSISRALTDSLTQFQAAVERLDRANDAEGLGKQTYAERAIVRLDFSYGGSAATPTKASRTCSRASKPSIPTTASIR